MLRIAGVECKAVITQVPEVAGASDLGQDGWQVLARLGRPEPLPKVALTPWRLQPSQARTAAPAPQGQGVKLGAPWPVTGNDAARGTALHHALRTHLMRPDLATSLGPATGLQEEELAALTERAAALKAWLTEEGYTELLCEIPVLGHSPEGAEIPGTIDLLALGPQGCLLIDHKSGGSGEGFGPYWPQLSSYAALVPGIFPKHPLRGVGIFWVDHGRLEIAGMEAMAEAG